MNTIDYAFLAVCVAVLGLMMALSKMVRAILWETVRYPFQVSHIEIREGQVVVTRSQSQPVKDGQPSSPAGAR